MLRMSFLGLIFFYNFGMVFGKSTQEFCVEFQNYSKILECPVPSKVAHTYPKSMGQLFCMETKECGTCREVLPITSYYRSSRDGYMPHCKHCTIEKQEASIRRKGKEFSWAKSKSTYVKRLYKITLQEYHDRLEKQNGKCGICQTNIESKPGYISNSAHLDHCHTTGQLRGFLCVRCNQGLGNFMDNPLLLKRAVKYLKKYSKNVD